MLLEETTLVPASVRQSATFLDAARVLASHEVAAIAVVDDDERVVGLFTSDALLAGIYPRYLHELHHTAFVPDTTDALVTTLERCGSDSVAEHMDEAVTVEQSTSGIHVGERFVHVEAGAIAVVDGDGKFVGMLGQIEFCRAIMRRIEA